MPKKERGNRSSKTLHGIAAVLVTGTMLSIPFSMFAPEVQAALNPAFIEQKHLGFADIVEKVRPAVVSIMVEKSNSDKTSSSYSFYGQKMPDDKRFKEFFKKFGFSREFGKQFGMPDDNGMTGHRATNLGSGFFVSDDGYIVTSENVIENAEKIRIRMHTGKLMNAELVGADPKTDLAVLKVEGKKFPYVSFGESNNAKTGDWVVTVGNRFGFSGATTASIITTLGRDMVSDLYGDYIQIDAPINRGNSGGPVFNTKGEVIGVSTLNYSPLGGNIGIGFAVASNTTLRVVESLITDGKVSRGWLGVMIHPITEDIASSLDLGDAEGALIFSVSDKSPAKKAELQPGDVVIGVDGKAIKSVRDLTRYISDGKPETTVSLKIWRNGKFLTKSIELSGQSDKELAELKTRKSSDTKLGLALQNSEKGVIVADVEPDSPAAKKGLAKGDIIARVNQNEVETAKDILNAISQAKEKGKDRILMLVKSSNGNKFIVLKLNRA